MGRPAKRASRTKPGSKPRHRRAPGTPRAAGQETVGVRMRVNGAPVTVEVPADERLLDTLRYRLGLTGTKEGCGEGECGACTVYLDGLPVDSCLVPTYQVRGASIQTIESMDPRELQPFLEHGSTQCGACTPGVIMMACWIRDHPELLERHSVRELMAGNLCRCTGYDGIVDGIAAARSPRTLPA
jgi:aerobic-type carbon monoxide dehydrogenase small subunit (CoxS/CutS family)